jgi:hypothetical protein
MSYYFHNVPGRLRIKTPRIKGNKDGALELQRWVSSMNGIRSAEANPLTGSLVIHFDEKRTCPESITHALSKAGYFDRSKAIDNDQYIYSLASSVLSLVASFI